MGQFVHLAGQLGGVVVARCDKCGWEAWHRKLSTARQDAQQHARQCREPDGGGWVNYVEQVDQDADDG